jgi:hypothetical protein
MRPKVDQFRDIGERRKSPAFARCEQVDMEFSVHAGKLCASGRAKSDGDAPIPANVHGACGPAATVRKVADERIDGLTKLRAK